MLGVVFITQLSRCRQLMLLLSCIKVFVRSWMCLPCLGLLPYHIVEFFFFFGKTVHFQNLKRQSPCPSLSIPKFSLLWLCNIYLTQPSHTLFLHTFLLILTCRPWQVLSIQSGAWEVCTIRGLPAVGQDVAELWGAGGTCRVPGWGWRDSTRLYQGNHSPCTHRIQLTAHQDQVFSSLKSAAA